MKVQIIDYKIGIVNVEVHVALPGGEYHDLTIPISEDLTEEKVAEAIRSSLERLATAMRRSAILKELRYKEIEI